MKLLLRFKRDPVQHQQYFEEMRSSVIKDMKSLLTSSTLSSQYSGLHKTVFHTCI